MASYPPPAFPTLPTSIMGVRSISALHCLIGLVMAVVILTFVYRKGRVALSSKNGIPLPPGPPAQWFWKNAFPSANIARTLADWVTEYGPLVTLRQGSETIIIIGRVDAANEIMEKEGSSLVDRPRSIAVGELLYNGLSFLLVGSGERFRRFRKAAHTHLQPKAVKAYREMQLGNAKNLITDILNDPRRHRAHAQRYAASVILRLAYGNAAPTSNDDPEVARIQQVMTNFSHAMRPGAYLVDRIPFLKHVPGYGRELKEFHTFERQLYRDQMDRVQSEMETNDIGESFMRTLLERMHEHGLSGDEMAYLAGNLYGAGSETTAVVITNMILAAACYPEAQRCIQRELDVVVGKDRMPNWEDLDSLPQIHAYVLETMRWRPVTPIGFAHRATQDIIWRGHCIPAGASVIGCHWAIAQDPVVFPEPEKFDPQRWLDDDGHIRKNMYAFPYGYGRRVCPGQYFANNSLYINLALLLWSFDIVARADAPIDVNDYSDGVISHAAPFDVAFVPRIKEEWLREMVAEATVL